MHRSASSSRVSDEYYMTAGQAVATRSAADIDHLPTYDPQLEIAKKETARLRLAENTVHLIPVIIIICAMLLWFFSNPGSNRSLLCNSLEYANIARFRDKLELSINDYCFVRQKLVSLGK
ncbi:hypothetical protein KSP39_PZI005582 [Platanthera zijinensis]|uniref:Transmembrane protein n=1 Tax=Platanthera zijinensis TaxID=2320716 RepID=A0AAP0BR69_9ASPA